MPPTLGLGGDRGRITPAAQPVMTNADFHRIREMAYAACGINLHQNKRALVSSRLERLVRRNGCASFSAYLNVLSQRRHGAEFTEFVDTLTTNHTGFWREPRHFEFLQKNILPFRRSRIRIWSAACATGEEPYTIGMCALESGVVNCRISASDISHAALGAALNGTYSEAKLTCLPAGWTGRYFQRPAQGGTRAATRAIRDLIDFQPLNLLAPLGHVGSFDVIFCRNVMIYFDQPTRDDLVARLSLQLASGGYLFTGHSETLLRLPAGLEYIQPATYRKS